MQTVLVPILLVIVQVCQASFLYRRPQAGLLNLLHRIQSSVVFLCLSLLSGAGGLQGGAKLKAWQLIC